MSIIKKGDKFFEQSMSIAATVQTLFGSSSPALLIAACGALLQINYGRGFSDPEEAMADFDRMAAFLRGQIYTSVDQRERKVDEHPQKPN